MTGIILLSFLFIVFVVYCLLIYLPIRWAKRHGITGRKRFYIGIASFIVVSVLFFGKNVVSYSAYKYYCANEAGLTVYKTLAQWQAENPGVWETLRKVNDFRDYEDKTKYPDVSYERFFDNKQYHARSSGNQRIILYSRDDYPFWGALRKHSAIFFDNKTQDILANYNYFQWTNTWGTTPNKIGWRGVSYLGNEICESERDKFTEYRKSFSNLTLTQEEK